MTPLPRSVIASLQYQELLQCCHELFHLALVANALSRRDARWYQSQLMSAWDDSWKSWDKYLASSAGHYSLLPVQQMCCVILFKGFFLNKYLLVSSERENLKTSVCI